MQKHRDITIKRIQSFKNKLNNSIYTKRAAIELSVFSPTDNVAHNRISFQEAIRGDFTPTEIGIKFEPEWSTHWFKVEISIPESWKNKNIHFLWNSKSEACIFSETGDILQGLSVDHKSEYALTDNQKTQNKLTLYVELACNTIFGVGAPDQYLDQESPTPAGSLEVAEIAIFNPKAWELYWDYIIVADMAEELSINSTRGEQALGAANKCINYYLAGDYNNAALVLKNFLKQKAGDGTLKLAAVGNAHTDTAWLWPVVETKRKIYRTVSAALRYMDDYPEYKFAWSQALYWDWAEKEHPSHFNEMKEKVSRGQLIPTGGAWVEPDCNLPSGESLIRQFLYGQRYYIDKLNYRCEIFWQPDVFGYSAQLPQIMKKCGLKYFLTQKMSWNQTNKMPHHSMIWQGLDGTEVLTHFPPADCYEGPATVKSIEYTRNNYKDKDRSDEAIYLYGLGDGGGGPTRGMLESIRRMNNLDGMPKVTQSTPIEFFNRLEKSSDELCKWVGELYLELHRGTYTSQAKQKLYNRKIELLMHNIELLYSVIGIEFFDKDEIDRIWKVILLNQFHDIIPGSSIQEVHEVSRKEYEETLDTMQSLLKQLLSVLNKNEGKKILAVNTISTARTEVVELPNSKDLAVIFAPSMGYSVSEPVKHNGSVNIKIEGEQYILQNKFIRAVFNSSGRLTSLYDYDESRELIPNGEVGNNLTLFNDKPINWDAWDSDPFHLETKRNVANAGSIKVVEDEQLRVAIEVEYKISDKSTMKQLISLTAISKRIDVESWVDWHETDTFLKVEFPWNIHSNTATYEVQFGHVNRTTHSNTSWDMAQFEVCAQKWADLSEYGYGISILNDCKYGYATDGNIMSLSLLRSPKRPDKTCDMGEHHFRYAILPHSGSFQNAGVIYEAQCFNNPMLLLPTSLNETSVSWFSTDVKNVIIDTVKPAEDGSAIIVRMYEAHGRRQSFSLFSSLPISNIETCNCLEEFIDKLVWDKKVDLIIKPFEIISLRVTL
ncbi:MAG: alpha-mannosidase [bacterium]|nr:alpha-mannosidase [bacterium]